MKQIITILQIVAFSLIFISAQATDREVRDLQSFSGISVSSGVNAEIIRGDHNEIAISVDGIELDRVETRIKNDVLVVSVKQKKFWFGGWKKKDIDVVITYTEELESLRASSGSQLYASHTIVTDDLDIDVSSGALIDVDLDANEVDIDISSGSVTKIAGVSDIAYIESSSGATFRGYDLRVDKVRTDGSSGSSIEITVLTDLRAEVSSGASVRYKGDPKNTEVDKGSGGSVKQVSSGI